MAKLSRVFQKIFGSGAGVNQIAQFGSLFAGSPSFTTDPATAQALSNWLVGWSGAAIGGNAPAIEDMNAAMFVMTYQLAYLMQSGIAEWDSSTTYFIGSLVSDGAGNVFISLQDNNVGQALTVAAYWRRNVATGAISTKTANYQVTANDGVLMGNAGAGGFTFTLPDSAANPGVPIYFEKIDSTTNVITILASGTDTIGGSTSIALRDQYQSIVLVPNGSGLFLVFGIPNGAVAWQGFHTTAASWARTNAIYGDPTNTGTPVLTQFLNSNFPTVVTAAGNIPGITFTPTVSGLYCIEAFPKIAVDTLNAYGNVGLVDAGASKFLCQAQTRNQVNGSSEFATVPLKGYVKMSAGVANTFKLQTSASAGSVTIFQGDNNQSQIEWSVTLVR